MPSLAPRLTEADRQFVRQRAQRRAADLAEIGDIGVAEFYKRCGKELPVVTINRGPFTLTAGATTQGTGFLVPRGVVALPVAIRQMTTPLVEKRVTGWPVQMRWRDQTTPVYPIRGARPTDARMSWPNGKGPDLAGLDPWIEGTRITPAVVLAAGKDAKAIFEIDVVLIPADEYGACSPIGVEDTRTAYAPREDELRYAQPWDSNVTRDNSGGTPQVTLAAEVGAEHELLEVDALGTAGGAVALSVDGTSRTLFVIAAGQSVLRKATKHADSNEALIVSMVGGGNLELAGRTWRLRGT